MLNQKSREFLDDVKNDLLTERKIDTTGCYYHGIEYRTGILNEILKSRAILCNWRLRKSTSILDPFFPSYMNGFFHISVTNKENFNDEKAAYYKYIRDKVSLIISPSINKIKTKHISEFEVNFIIEFISRYGLMPRFSDYPDEYQVRDRIDLNDIIGIQYRLYGCLNDFEQNKAEWLNGLYILGSIVNILEENDIDLPIVDEETNIEISKKLIRKYYNPTVANYNIHDYFN